VRDHRAKVFAELKDPDSDLNCRRPCKPPFQDVFVFFFIFAVAKLVNPFDLFSFSPEIILAAVESKPPY
jgi:hypothetical protein